MITNERFKVRPLLTCFEEEIPEQATTQVIEYDETRMILLADGKPALFAQGLTLNGATKLTRVNQETVDDD